MTPTLYILMREDLPDCNPGKGMAQCAHAQADFDRWVTKRMYVTPDYCAYIYDWKEDRNFGRTLILQATLEDMKNIGFSTLDSEAPMGVTVDPTYPWRNFYGKVFLTSEVTCAWIFVCDLTPPEIVEELKKLPLHQ